jgi:hypothetical protein
MSHSYRSHFGTGVLRLHKDRSGYQVAARYRSPIFTDSQRLQR